MIEIDASSLEQLHAALRALAVEEIPTAMRNTLNDTAYDVLKVQEREIPRVFDKPVPVVQKPFFVQRATREVLTAKLRVKDRLQGGPIEKALEPHIAGFSPNRISKGLERGLRAAGLLGDDEYLTPTSAMALNQYGNITAPKARKMLNESKRYSASNTYFWLRLRLRNGGREVAGVWDRKKFRNHEQKALLMQVAKRPSYRKRYPFYDLGHAEANRVMPAHARLALEHALRRAFG